MKREKGESTQKPVDKFWDLHCKVVVFENTSFSKQQQLCYVVFTKQSMCIHPKPETKFYIKVDSLLYCCSLGLFLAKASHISSNKSKEATHKEQATDYWEGNDNSIYKGSNFVSFKILEIFTRRNNALIAMRWGIYIVLARSNTKKLSLFH